MNENETVSQETQEIKTAIIKFVKRTKLTTSGTTDFFFTTKDGVLVDDSMSLDEAEAKAFYDRFVELSGDNFEETVIATTTLKI